MHEGAISIHAPCTGSDSLGQAEHTILQRDFNPRSLHGERHEIDRMDMPGFLKIRAWNARYEKKKKEPKPRYIDEVWPNLKPGG